MKKCSKCKEIKPFGLFGKSKSNGGWQAYCKGCQSKNIKKRYLQTDSGKRKLEYNQLFSEGKKRCLCCDKIKPHKLFPIDREWGPDEYHRHCKGCMAEKRSERRQKFTSLDLIKEGLRTRLNSHLKDRKLKRDKSIEDILGLNIKDFIIYIENQFTPDMNWENRGIYWELDHIIPLSKGKSKDEIYKLTHYTNFQPLYWVDNRKKSNKLK